MQILLTRGEKIAAMFAKLDEHVTLRVDHDAPKTKHHGAGIRWVMELEPTPILIRVLVEALNAKTPHHAACAKPYQRLAAKLRQALKEAA
jgi:hypothetical protein